MKEQFVKWMPFLALAFFTAAVFMIAEGYFLPGIVLIGAGSGFLSAAAFHKKKNDGSDKEPKTE